VYPRVVLKLAVWISIVIRFRSSIDSRASASISLASIGTALSNPRQYRMITRACRRSAAMIMITPTSAGAK
jgi:hypothetical protein